MKKFASALNALVTIEVLAPSLSAPISLKRSETISERSDVVEVPDISRDDLSGDSFQVVPVSTDFTADHVHIRYLSSGMFANVGSGNFNGYRLQWSLPLGVSLRTYSLTRATATMSMANITRVATNTIAINFNALPFQRDQGFSLRLGFSCTGTDAADELTGANGADAISGLAGDDQIDGGLGKDRLTGGEGSDTFVFTAIGSKHMDRITDFDPFRDKILLDFTAFATLSAGPLAASQFGSSREGFATTGQQRILYSTQSGQLFYDPDGSGPLGRQVFAQLDASLPLTSSHFFVS